MTIQQYITESNVHGQCDVCGLDGSINKVIGDYYLCRYCIENVDSRADALVYAGDTDVDNMNEAFKQVLEENTGKTLILHFPDGNSPEGTHTYTVTHVEHFELEFEPAESVRDGVHKVYVECVGGESDTYYGRGLTVSGMS